MSYISLVDLELSETAVVHKIHLAGDLRRRLLDLGFSPGVTVTPLFRSPFGDPTAYRVLSSVIALRKEDAKQIEILSSKKEEKK